MSTCRGALLWVTLGLVVAVQGDTCVSSPQCSCDFVGEGVVGTTKAEYLAGVVGALGPLLATGAGLGIYKLIKVRTGPSGSGFQRAPSDISDESYQETKQKKCNVGRRNGTAPSPMKNDADPSDNRRDSNATRLSVTDYDGWDEDSFDMDDPRSYTGSALSPSGVSARISPHAQSSTPISLSGAPKKDNINSWMNF